MVIHVISNRMWSNLPTAVKLIWVYDMKMKSTSNASGKNSIKHHSGSTIDIQVTFNLGWKMPGLKERTEWRPALVETLKNATLEKIAGNGHAH